MPHRKRHEAAEARINQKSARLGPAGSPRYRVSSPTVSCLHTSSTLAGASPRHTARHRNRPGPAPRMAQSQCDGSRYTLRQRTGSGIRIWSGTETLASARKHGKRPAHPPPPRRNTGGRHYFRALWTPWTPLCTPISIVVFGDNSGSVEPFLKNPRLTASLRLQNSVYPRPFPRLGGYQPTHQASHCSIKLRRFANRSDRAYAATTVSCSWCDSAASTTSRA